MQIIWLGKLKFPKKNLSTEKACYKRSGHITDLIKQDHVKNYIMNSSSSNTAQQ